jgi:hypothetical protein
VGPLGLGRMSEVCLVPYRLSSEPPGHSIDSSVHHSTDSFHHSIDSIHDSMGSATSNSTFSSGDLSGAELERLLNTSRLSFHPCPPLPRLPHGYDDTFPSPSPYASYPISRPDWSNQDDKQTRDWIGRTRRRLPSSSHYHRPGTESGGLASCCGQSVAVPRSVLQARRRKGMMGSNLCPAFTLY